MIELTYRCVKSEHPFTLNALQTAMSKQGFCSLQSFLALKIYNLRAPPQAKQTVGFSGLACCIYEQIAIVTLLWSAKFEQTFSCSLDNEPMALKRFLTAVQIKWKRKVLVGEEHIQQNQREHILKSRCGGQEHNLEAWTHKPLFGKMASTTTSRPMPSGCKIFIRMPDLLFIPELVSTECHYYV